MAERVQTHCLLRGRNVHMLRALFPVCSVADGVYTGEWTTMALCGFIRSMGEGDGCLDRLWTSSYDAAKAAGSDI